MRGKLYVVFDVVFPEPHFLTEDGFKQLEKLLVRRPIESLPVGQDVHEVSLHDFDSRRHGQGRNNRREAYHDDSDDEEAHGRGGQNVQCASH